MGRKNIATMVRRVSDVMFLFSDCKFSDMGGV
jgi:hypothetical protein